MSSASPTDLSGLSLEELVRLAAFKGGNVSAQKKQEVKEARRLVKQKGAGALLELGGVSVSASGDGIKLEASEAQSLHAMVRAEADEDLAQIEELYMVPRHLVTPRLNQPRRHFAPEEMESLRDSIRSLRDQKKGLGATGIVQPLTVRRLPVTSKTKEDSPRFEIVAGERRYRAAEMAGLTHLPCHVEEMSEKQTLAVSIVENLQRQDLTPLEYAYSIRALMNEFDLSARSVARMLGKTPSWIDRRLRLMEMPEDVQVLITQRPDTIEAARLLNGVKDQKVRARWIEDVKDGSVSSRELEERVRAHNAKQREIKADNRTLVEQLPESIVPAVVPRINIPDAIASSVNQARESVRAWEGAALHQDVARKKVMPLVKELRELCDRLEELARERVLR
jgi:ParB family chromosome partitioning protein